MGYALIWMAGLATALLFVAFATALAGRGPSALVRRLLAGVVALLMLIVAVAAVLPAAAMKFGLHLPHSWFGYALSWAVCLVVGAALVLWIGLRRGTAPMPRAAFWPRGKLLAAFAAGLALTAMTFWNLDLAALNQVAALRVEAGQLALSVAPVRLPETQNAAPLYHQAFEAIGRVKKPEEFDAWVAWLEGKDMASPPPGDAALAAYLAAQAPALALLREAAARPGCFFERDYARPSIDMLLPEVVEIVAAGRLVALDARARAAEGRADDALRDVQALFHMARHARAEPMTISAVVSMMLDRTAGRALEAVLAEGRPDAAALASLDLGPPPDYYRGLGRTLRAEEAFGLWTLADLASAENIDLLGMVGLRAFPAGLRPAYRVFLLGGDVRGYRDAMRRYRDLASEPCVETRRRPDQTDAPLEARRAGLLGGVLLPALNSIFETAARADAEHDLARLAVGAAQFRAETDAPPVSLDALVPKYLPLVPRDPFDGKFLRMAAKEGAIVFYSVGPDGTDDGGAPLDAQEKTGDLTFHLPAK